MKTGRLLAFALICAQTSFAQTAVTPDRIGEVDSFLTAMHSGGKFNGGILMAEKGKVLYHKYFGYANIPGKIPFNDSSTFNVASVSKTFTAIAVLQLMEKKKLRLDDPFVNYFPEFPYPTVRIRQMLNHTSGIPAEFDFFGPVLKKYPDSVLLNKDIIQVLKAYGKPLVFPPGDRYQYCNANYELLALLVEKISRVSFGEYLRQHVFRPAHMDHSYVRRVDAPEKDDYAVINHVYPHEYSLEYGNVDTLKKGRFRDGNIAFGGTVGDNNVITTLGDLLQYDRALYGEGLLRTGTLRLAFEPTRLNNGQVSQFSRDSTLPFSSYGLGWHNSVDTGADKIVFHHGYNFGISSMLYRNITRDLTIVFFDNTNNDQLYKTMAIARLLDGKAPRKEWAFAFDLKKSIARVYGHDLVEKGADAAFIHLCALRQDSLHYYLNRRQVTLMGYDLLENGFKELGLESFRVNTLLFPKDMGAYGNYGLALSDHGKKEEAIAVYRTALAQNPDDKNIKEFLDRELSEKRVRDSVVARGRGGAGRRDVAVDRVSRIDSFITVLEQNQLFNGSVLVAEDGKVIYKRSVGYADREHEIANTDTTCFNIASASKPFTSLAVLQLAEKGKLKLDDPVAKYFPDLPYPGITIRHLLSQTSGLPILERYEDGYVKAHPDEIITPAKAYADLVSLKQPLSFQPGDNWSYNNVNYMLLAMLVEKVSQLPFPQYMWKNIFSPAGMEKTYVRGPHSANTPRYIFPAMYDSVYRNVDLLDHTINYTDYNLGGIQGPGNVISTTGDLFRFDNALNEGKLIRLSFLRQAFVPLTFNNGKAFRMRNSPRSYGLGWNVLEEPWKDTVAFHDGHVIGIITMFLKDLTKKHTIICYDNMENTSAFFQKIGTITRILTDQPLVKMDLRRSLVRAYGQLLVAKGTDEAMIRFNEMKTDTAHYYFDEQEMNQLGYDLLSKASFAGHNEMAAEVFKINVLLYPKEYNVYDSYADALLKCGKREAAMAMYEESIKRDPAHHGGQSAMAMKLAEKGQGARQ